MGAPVRGAGVIAEREHDPYRQDAKLAEPAMCPDCGAAFHDGRWQWVVAQPGARETLCPACRRVKERLPAGYVTLDGAFARDHRDEVLALVNHRAERARAEHPLQRLMGIEDRDGALLVTTTDTHLARGIGQALHDAYRGELRFHHEKGQELLRVHWTR
jgi:hypothetical protein